MPCGESNRHSEKLPSLNPLSFPPMQCCKNKTDEHCIQFQSINYNINMTCCVSYLVLFDNGNVKIFPDS